MTTELCVPEHVTRVTVKIGHKKHTSIIKRLPVRVINKPPPENHRSRLRVYRRGMQKPAETENTINDWPLYKPTTTG